MSTYDDSSVLSLPQTKCLITTHDKSGKAKFYERPSGSDEVTLKRAGPAAFHVLFTTNKFPVDFKDDGDVKDYLNLNGVLPVSLPGGSVVRMVDCAPLAVSPIHRTSSLDYGVVIEGEMELILEDLDHGPRRLMKRGDVSIQRGTMHAWRNPSATQWSRMLYVLLEAKPVTVGGAPLKEDLGHMELPEQ